MEKAIEEEEVWREVMAMREREVFEVLNGKSLV